MHLCLPHVNATHQMEPLSLLEQHVHVRERMTACVHMRAHVQVKHSSQLGATATRRSQWVTMSRAVARGCAERWHTPEAQLIGMFGSCSTAFDYPSASHRLELSVNGMGLRLYSERDRADEVLFDAELPPFRLSREPFRVAGVPPRRTEAQRAELSFNGPVRLSTPIATKVGARILQAGTFGSGGSRLDGVHSVVTTEVAELREKIVRLQAEAEELRTHFASLRARQVASTLAALNLDRSVSYGGTRAHGGADEQLGTPLLSTTRADDDRGVGGERSVSEPRGPWRFFDAILEKLEFIKDQQYQQSLADQLRRRRSSYSATRRRQPRVVTVTPRGTTAAAEPSPHAAAGCWACLGRLGCSKRAPPPARVDAGDLELDCEMSSVSESTPHLVDAPAGAAAAADVAPAEAVGKGVRFVRSLGGTSPSPHMSELRKTQSSPDGLLLTTSRISGGQSTGSSSTKYAPIDAP